MIFEHSRSLPIDGVNQWQVITGESHKPARSSIYHNIAVVDKVLPINVGNSTHQVRFET